MRARIKVDADKAIATLADVVKRYRSSPAALFHETARRWQSELPGRVESLGLAPLSAATIRIRGWLHGPAKAAGPILNRTGELLGSLKIEGVSDRGFTLRPSAKFADDVEYGSQTAAGSFLPGRPVPARPWVFLSGADLNYFFSKIDQQFLPRR